MELRFWEYVVKNEKLPVSHWIQRTRIDTPISNDDFWALKNKLNVVTLAEAINSIVSLMSECYREGNISR